MTRIRPFIAVLMTAISFTAASALAQEAPRTTGKPDRDTQRRAAFDRIDANKDGFIDRAESRVAREAIFDRLDANKDGRLSPDELTANRRPRAQAPRGRDGGVNSQTNTTPSGPTATRPTRADREFQRLDTNRDGFISRAEWLAADDARFERCDRNKDGKLAFDECRTAQAGQQRAGMR